MSNRSVEHATFVVRRSYDASPPRTFAAWAEADAKSRWFAGGESEYELDFRVGGRERHRGAAPDGRAYAFDAIYHEIVSDERIVYSYEMFIDEVRISVSLATVEFRPEGNGTNLIFTEQAAFLDGHETPESREGGTGPLLDALGEELRMT
jgi:uncharacterized protein YndB with AHSA1/START domain